LDLNTAIDNQKGEYTFSNCAIEIGRLKISFAGVYTDSAAPHLDFSASGVDMDIRSLLSLMPAGYEHYVDRYESVGKLSATLRLKGKIDENTTPALRIEFSSDNLSVENTRENIAFEQINCKGRFENRPGGYLRFDAFEGVLNNGSIKGKCEISNFSRPRFSFDLNATINLSDIQRFVELKPVHQLSGDASIQLKMNANSEQVEQFTAGGYKTMQANGNIRINNASFRIDGDTLDYTGFGGNFNFDGNTVNVSEFSGKVGQSDFKLYGKLSNLFGWLFDEQEAIGIAAHVESRLVKLDELFSRRSEQKPGGEEHYTLRISPRLNLNLSARVANLTFQRFKANAISGKIDVAGSTLSANQLSFQTMNGNVLLNGTVNPASNNNLVIQCDANLKHVDIRQLFFECENFGQLVLQDKNLRGILDASIQFSALADVGLNIDATKVLTKADLRISRGELIDFEPLEPLSKYIALEELRHVKFSQLKNTIEIRNESIYIPSMNIESSAMSLSASGIHSFDNEIEYHIKLLLSDLLAKKAKRARKEVEEF
ncbi:MAG: AsmA-like C-terminal region-containing protein, partial [Bacteroidia bacterium]